jgi:hypothetical protein
VQCVSCVLFNFFELPDEYHVLITNVNPVGMCWVATLPNPSLCFPWLCWLLALSFHDLWWYCVPPKHKCSYKNSIYYCTCKVLLHQIAESLVPVSKYCCIHCYADEKLCAKYVNEVHWSVQDVSNFRNRREKGDHRIKHMHMALVYSHSTSLTNEMKVFIIFHEILNLVLHLFRLGTLDDSPGHLA